MSRKLLVSLGIVILLTSCLSTVYPARALPRTLRVPEDYPTIAGAIAAAFDGDTVRVRSGSYYEQLSVDKAIALIGESRETTVINGGGRGTVVAIRHDDVNFTGFTVIYSAEQATPQPIWMWSTRLGGIHVLDVKNCNVSGNKVSDCGAGIWLYDVHDSNVSNNVVYRNDYGIRVEASRDNTFVGNNVTGNWGGIRLISTENNVFINNKIRDNTQNFGVTSAQLQSKVDRVDASNTVNGKPIYYWVGASNRTVPSDAGFVVLVNSTGVKVQGLTLSNNQNGIALAGTSNCLVTGNSVSACGEGISLYNSTYDVVMRNDLTCNNGIATDGNGTRITDNTVTSSGSAVSASGMYLVVVQNRISVTEWQTGSIIVSGQYTNVSRNQVEGTSYTYATVEGSHNIVYENTIRNSDRLEVKSSQSIVAKNTLTGTSLSVSDCSETEIFGNTISDGYTLGVAGHGNLFYANQVENCGYAVSISGTEAYSYNNTIYRNNFLQSRDALVKNYENSANFWDNGFEGNYWIDYGGQDVNQDGIGDTPYSIMGQRLDMNLRTLVPFETGQDRFPLMTPFPIASVNISAVMQAWATSIPPLPDFPPPTTEQPTATPTKAPPPSTSAEPMLTPSQTTSPLQTLLPSPTVPEFSLVAVLAVAATAGGVLILCKWNRLKNRKYFNSAKGLSTRLHYY